MKKVIFLISAFCILSSAVNGYAFRCNGEPIGRWDKKEKVLNSCGKSFTVGNEKVYWQDRFIYAETWYYNCGDHDFVYAVSFYNNIVIREEPRKRGSGNSKCGQ